MQMIKKFILMLPAVPPEVHSSAAHTSQTLFLRAHGASPGRGL